MELSLLKLKNVNVVIHVFTELKDDVSLLQNEVSALKTLNSGEFINFG